MFTVRKLQKHNKGFKLYLDMMQILVTTLENYKHHRKLTENQAYNIRLSLAS